MNTYNEFQTQNKNCAHNINNCQPDYIDTDNFSEQMKTQRSNQEKENNSDNLSKSLVNCVKNIIINMEN